MNELKEQKLFITSAIAKKYVNELPSSLLMYCLNFQMRKRNVAAIVSQGEMEIEEDKMDEQYIVVDEDAMEQE